MKPKISIITLGVKDVATSRAFYEKLGFPIVGEPKEEYVMFDMEWTKLALFPKEMLAKDANTPLAEGGIPSVTLAHNEPSKEEVNKTMDEVRAAGAKIVKEPEDVFWGGYSGYFQDPDGYLWEVAWNPFDDLS